MLKRDKINFIAQKQPKFGYQTITERRRDAFLGHLAESRSRRHRNTHFSHNHAGATTVVHTHTPVVHHASGLACE
jgi:hypothetical protein